MSQDPIPGVRFRPATPADLDDLHAMQVRAERHDRLPMLTPRHEIAEWFDDPDLNPATDTRVAESEGRIVGWARVWYRPSDEREERAFVVGAVDPGARGRGIGRALFIWELERAREILGVAAPGLPRYVRAWAYDFQSGPARLFERAGFRRVRHAVEMVRPLDAPLAAIAAGVSVVPWDPARFEEARLVMNDAFADHWGSTPRTAESWRHENASASVRLDLSFVALEHGRVVGVTRNGYFADDGLHPGRRDGWILQIGVLRSHRRRGVASALIAASIDAFRSAGLTHALLGVDIENPNGALGLYERLGFRAAHANVVFQLEV